MTVSRLSTAALRCFTLTLTATVLPVAASAQSTPCNLTAPSIQVAQTQRLEAERACVYHVRIPDDAYATRSFKLLVPDSFVADHAAPRLVLDFHGFGASKSNQMQQSCWRQKAVEEGFVVAYPNGTGVPTSFSAGEYCCNLAVGLPRDDVQFSRDVVAEARAILEGAPSLTIDTAAWKTYASGLSNGGAMAHELACEASDLFDGVAPVSQTFTKRKSESCLEAGERRIPVIDFRATNDTMIPYEGGTSFGTLYTQNWLSAEESRVRWEKALGCNGGIEDEEYGDGSYCLRMKGCAADFVQCTIAGKHVPYADAAAEEIDICDAAWEFFGEQPTNTLP